MIVASEPANAEQATLWNGRVGDTWVAQQEMLDRLFLPFERLLADVVRISGARHVLDIGCGAGATSIAAARAIGPHGRCTGIDISVPLIEAARRRAEAADMETMDFIAGDAQVHPFPPDSFDAIISRFGVMFFDAPDAAFANLRRAACAGADMTLIAWRSREENSFMTVAERAAGPWLPQLSGLNAGDPGQFAFADPERTARLLSSGWSDIDIQPVDIECTLTGDDLRTYATSMGRVGAILPDLDEQTRAAILDAVMGAYEEFVSDGRARFTAANWLIRARAA